MTHTLVQRGHFDSILWHAQSHLLVLRHEGELPILLCNKSKFLLKLLFSFLRRGLLSPTPHLSSIDISDELQRLLQSLAHAELQLLDGSHILHAELSTRFRRAVAFRGQKVIAVRQGSKISEMEKGGAGTDRSSWWSPCRGWQRCLIWRAPPDWSPLTFQEDWETVLTAGKECIWCQNEMHLCWCTLLLVLISLLCELLLLWRFLTFRNILHHDEPPSSTASSATWTAKECSVKHASSTREVLILYCQHI